MKVEDIKKIIGDKHLSKSRGQILLLDENIAKGIAYLIDNVKDNRILEIGPGLGIITRYLLDMGYKVAAVEIDKDFCKFLRDREIDVVNEDFLKLTIDSSMPNFVLGALPFSVSLRILLKLKDYRNHFYQWIVIIQKEVAERLTSKPNRKSYSSLSILFQILYEMNIAFDISPNSFFPKPEVTSTVIKAHLNKNPVIEVTKKFERFLQDIFRFRRKMLKNNLFDYNIKDISIPLDRRAESLSIDEVVQIYKEVTM